MVAMESGEEATVAVSWWQDEDNVNELSVDCPQRRNLENQLCYSVNIVVHLYQRLYEMTSEKLQDSKAMIWKQFVCWYTDKM